jgi:hypothetical protein
MDGLDHVSIAQMPIGWRGSLDLKNRQLAGGHVAPMDGQDFEVVDWLKFSSNVSFRCSVLCLSFPVLAFTKAAVFCSSHY